MTDRPEDTDRGKSTEGACPEGNPRCPGPEIRDGEDAGGDLERCFSCFVAAWQ